MPLKFTITRRQSGFLDPFNDFKPAKLTVEVRTDPLSGHMARVLSFRARELGPVDHGVYLKRAAKMSLPLLPGKHCSHDLALSAPRKCPRAVSPGARRSAFPTPFPMRP